MDMFRAAGWIGLAGLLMSPAPFRPVDHLAGADLENRSRHGRELSVMTYNVKGLPWPVAWDRGRAIAAIGAKLATMRERAVQPQVVLLQEAFVDDAKAIARVAGYRYVAHGPRQAPAASSPPLGNGFAAQARWDRGERSETVLDSGLVILSDFPIVRSRNFAFPHGACAGFDCLAAKGAMIAWISVPDAPQPIAFLNTHLNSRHSAHVASERADRAYVWQLDAVRRFASANIDEDAPVILGGDFNTGKAPRRLAAFAKPILSDAEQNDLPAVLALQGVDHAMRIEAIHILKRNKDKLISRSGSSIRLAPRYVSVPFAIHSPAAPLSDHAGFLIVYEIG